MRVLLTGATGFLVVILYPGVIYGPGELTDGNLVVKMIRDHLRGRLRGMLGPGDYAPTPLREGLRRTVGWLRERGLA